MTAFLWALIILAGCRAAYTIIHHYTSTTDVTVDTILENVDADADDNPYDHLFEEPLDFGDWGGE